jgi:hypothetical protein
MRGAHQGRIRTAGCTDRLASPALPVDVADPKAPLTRTAARGSASGGATTISATSAMKR